MIRINLSGAARPKGKRAAAAAPEFAGEGPSSVVFILIGVVLAVAINGGLWWYLDGQSKRLDAKMATANKEYDALQATKQRVDQKQKLADDIRRRTDVIDKLRKEQSGPVELLSMVGDTVNSTDAIWLATMKDDGSNLNLEGVAFSPHAVANLMANLKRTGYFRSVELKEAIQDETVKDMQAFNFTIICEKKPKS
ncbi:MAG TPA: PilN domain-containing protein [Terriglobales bacterium]|nr:PilN domain-containing protein [Terriglobales bacterium]